MPRTQLTCYRICNVLLMIDNARCMDVHNGNSKELFPVALGITDDDGKYHLIEASRSLARQ